MREIYFRLPAARRDGVSEALKKHGQDLEIQQHCEFVILFQILSILSL